MTKEERLTFVAMNISQIEEELELMGTENEETAFLSEYHASDSGKMYFGFLEDLVKEYDDLPF